MLYDQNIINNIKELLTTKHLTLSVAESVTAGHLQAAFSSAIDAAKFFQGGITAYNAGQKTKHLNIEPIAALEDDCVTEKVACEMALQVNQLFISDYGIAITGYATKMPEKGLNDLFAFFAIANKKEILSVKKITTNKERVDAQIDYTTQVIKEFRELLKNTSSV
ncbi:MAG: nicotinamide-nucleotide amidohydrolase family protein [Chitinophagaceae bacterium]|nr:nicotinamide-nucleotide amidohydrolase family protein [Chitinophagaceae bacterium]